MMKKTRRALLWFFLLNKRFLKKPLLLLLLCLIPLMTILARRLPSGSGSLLTVGLATDSPDDALAKQVIDSLVSQKSVGGVRYLPCSSGNELRQAVYDGRVRVGFLFPDDLSALISAYAEISDESSGGALGLLGQALGVKKQTDVDKGAMAEHAVRVICGSNDIVTKLEKEHFFGSIYDTVGLAVLKSWMDVHAADFSMNKEDRDRFLEEAVGQQDTGNSFFRLAYENGQLIREQDMDDYYLTPMRGLLIITLVLICFASCLFLMEDNRRGLFVWISPSLRPLFHYLYLMIPVIDGGIFAYLALGLSGALEGGNEFPAFLLALLSIVGFSNLIRVLTGKMTLFSATIPIVIMGCIFLTPVFLDLRIVPAVQTLLPPYLYLKSLHGEMSLFPLFLYALISGASSVTLDYIKNR